MRRALLSQMRYEADVAASPPRNVYTTSGGLFLTCTDSSAAHSLPLLATAGGTLRAGSPTRSGLSVLPRLLPVSASIWRPSGKSTIPTSLQRTLCGGTCLAHLRPLGPEGMSQLQSLCESAGACPDISVMAVHCQAKRSNLRHVRAKEATQLQDDITPVPHSLKDEAVQTRGGTCMAASTNLHSVKRFTTEIGEGPANCTSMRCSESSKQAHFLHRNSRHQPSKRSEPRLTNGHANHVSSTAVKLGKV